jgi:hypothetical protein
MTHIACVECSTGTTYRVQPDATFKCTACGHILDVRDLVFDSDEIWTVDETGALGYVENPARLLEEMGEALSEFTMAEVDTYAKTASRNDFRDAAARLRVSLARLLFKQHFHARAEVAIAVNAGVDLILDGFDCGERDSDLIGLVVNAAMTLLDNPSATLGDVLAGSYDSPEEVRSWWGGWAA